MTSLRIENSNNIALGERPGSPTVKERFQRSGPGDGCGKGGAGSRQYLLCVECERTAATATTSAIGANLISITTARFFWNLLIRLPQKSRFIEHCRIHLAFFQLLQSIFQVEAGTLTASLSTLLLVLPLNFMSIATLTLKLVGAGIIKFVGLTSISWFMYVVIQENKQDQYKVPLLQCKPHSNHLNIHSDTHSAHTVPPVTTKKVKSSTFSLFWLLWF